ncbi:hypothetical protein EDB81DRAFT_632861, partial [Dactylonectria macrodidyma]
FCNVCGDTLPISTQKKVKCDCCGELNTSMLYASLCYSAQRSFEPADTLLITVSISSTNDFPSALRDKRAVTAPTALVSTDTWPSIVMQCQKCSSKEIRYTTLQLRGADEGITVFYFCPTCSSR